MLEGKYKFNIYTVENVIRHFLPQINVFEHIKFTFINLCCRHKEKVPFFGISDNENFSIIQGFLFHVESWIFQFKTRLESLWKVVF